MAARLNDLELREPLIFALIAIPIGLLAGLQPTFAIAAALGLGFVLFAVTDLSAGLAVFVFVSFMAQIPNVAGPAVSFVKLAGLLLAASWIGTLALGQKPRANLFNTRPGFTYAMVLFLALNGLSLLWATDGGEVISATYRFALNMSLVLIIFTAVQTEKHLRWVIIAFVLGATASAVYGLVHPPGAEEDPTRIAGTIGNANELASAMIGGLALAAGLGFAARSSIGKLLGFGACGICLFALFLTVSRGGLIGLGVMLVAAVLVVGGRQRARIGIGVLLVALVVVGYFAAIAPPEARERITEQNGGTGRVDLWTVGKRMVEANPITGVGAGNFATDSVHYLLEPGRIERSDFIVDDPQPTHNTYLEVFAELGIPGGILFMGIIFASIVFGVRAQNEFRRKNRRSLQMLATASVLALIGTLGSDIFISDQYSKQLWILIGLGPALLLIAEQATVLERLRQVRTRPQPVGAPRAINAS